ncbi:MAG: transglutaminase-like cysteine peptidase [Candidatus Paceibacterota bacterium]
MSIKVLLTSAIFLLLVGVGQAQESNAPAAQKTFCASGPEAAEICKPAEHRDDSAALLREVLAEIDTAVNQSMVYATDMQVHGVAEHWSFGSIAADGKRYGDCEDYALTKMYNLLERGVDRAHLILAYALTPGTDLDGVANVAFNGENRVGHFVLMVDHVDGLLVLDNFFGVGSIKSFRNRGYHFQAFQDPTNPDLWYDFDQAVLEAMS